MKQNEDKMIVDYDNIPPPPAKPDPLECCGEGCVPCVYDFYYAKLEEWEESNEISLADYLKAKTTSKLTETT